MLSLLPPELLQQIIESTIPHAFHSQTYDERQATLLRLSLVSRRFRQIAQPLLFEIVSVQTPEKLETVSEITDGKGWSDVILEVICQRRYDDAIRGSFSRRNFESLARSGKNLRTAALRLERQGVLDLSVLQLLPRESSRLVSSRLSFRTTRVLKIQRIFAELNHLRLSGEKLEITSPFKLPRLLTICLNSASLRACKTLLNPVYLPSLRDLALPDVDNAEDFEVLRHSSIDKLIPQLDSISLYWRCVDCAPEYLRKIKERTLFDCFSYDVEGFWEETSAHLHNLRIIHVPLDSTIDELSTWIIRIAIWIETHQQLPLHSLYLESILHPTALHSQPEDVRDGMDYLVRVCREKEVEIVFESQPRDWQVDPTLSEEFCRRQRRIREKEHGN